MCVHKPVIHSIVIVVVCELFVQSNGDLFTSLVRQSSKQLAIVRLSVCIVATK